MTFPRRVFLRTIGFGAAGLGLASSPFECLATGSEVSSALPRSSPESQGVSSADLLAFLEAAEKSGLEFHSFMMVRHGKVIAEGWWSPYRRDLNHMLYSLSKSFTSTAVGLAINEGKLRLDAPVVSFFPDELPPTVGPNLSALQIKHLLTMSAGFTEDPSDRLRNKQDWVKVFLSEPIPQPPGSLFVYSSIETYMLSAILQKITGMKLVDYLTPRIFEPLAIREMTWETCPMGINTGGWGLTIQTESIAKFGQLYLQNGQWNGRQIVPVSWVREATRFQIQQPAKKGQDLEQLKHTSEWHQGYGYQFWRSRHNAYRADGAFGQFCIVSPELDTVVAVTSESSSMGDQMNLVWDYLLPAIKPHPLQQQKTQERELEDKLSKLALLPPLASPTSAIAAQISGKSYRIEPNSMGVANILFDLKPDQCQFVLTDATGDYPITCGMERWVDGKTSMPGTPPKLSVGKLAPVQPIVASATWKDPQTLQMTWRFYATPHHDTVTCRFDGDQVKVQFMNSVAQLQPDHPESRPSLQGRLTG